MVRKSSNKWCDVKMRSYYGLLTQNAVTMATTCDCLWALFSADAEKSFRNLSKSNRNQIVFTIFRLIWNQTDVRLVPNQSKNGKYNLISGWFEKKSKKFLSVYEGNSTVKLMEFMQKINPKYHKMKRLNNSPIAELFFKLFTILNIRVDSFEL